MKEKQIDISNAKGISVTGTFKRAYHIKSVVHYLSGIDKFDEFLDGRKFSETKYQLIIIESDLIIAFNIFLEKTLSTFYLYKSDIKDIILHKNQAIEIDTLGEKEDRLGAFAALGGIVGGVVAIATDTISNAMKKDKLFVKSKKYNNGNIYEIIVQNEKDRIMLTTLDGDNLENVNSFFSKALNFDFSGKFKEKVKSKWF